MAASSLSGLYDAPILLSAPNKISTVSNEIKRLGAKNIIIIGGDKAVTNEEEKAYKALGNLRRIQGANRYETATKIATEVIDKEDSDSVIVASGENFPDALTVGAVANKDKTPIILANKDSLPASKEITKKIKKATIIGGPVAVGSVEKNFSSSNRIAGSNRYETSTKVADKYFNDASKAAIASGENYPDALALSPYAAKENMPILLSPAKGKNVTVEKYIKDKKITDIEIFGGEKAVEYKETPKTDNKQNGDVKKPEPSKDNNSKVSKEYQSALKSAQFYSEDMHMSKNGIYDQLISEYGDKFSKEAAQYAIDNLKANYKENALKSAKFYSEDMYMSKKGIYDQLTSDYGDKFTQEEAQYAVDNLKADYKQNALKSANQYQEMMYMSPEAIRDQLTSEYGDKFTQEEAEYAMENLNK